MIVKKKPTPTYEAVQWHEGVQHPRIEECSCHPDKRSVMLPGMGMIWLKDGDWILTDTDTKEIHAVCSNERFEYDYEELE